MISLTLRALVERAMLEGWAVGDDTLDDIEWKAGFLGWEIVPSRAAGPATELLKPTSQRDAPKQPLSAKYGRGDQPLHTDGAHHPDPPDVVLLSADGPSDVPTLLWNFGDGIVHARWWADLRGGLFTVRSGPDAFLAPAWDGSRIRFDPGCMDPSDQRARSVVTFFESMRAEAERHDWTESGKVLAIDNRRVLHARASAEGEPDRLMHRVGLKVGGATK